MIKHLVLPLSLSILFMSSAAGSEQYKIQKGDTLQKIANHRLGTKSRWKEILAINYSVISGNGNLIFPGQIINIPSAKNNSSGKPAKVEKTATKRPAANKNTKSEKILMVTGEFAPFTGEKLENKGLFTEIVETAFNNLDYKYEVDFMGWENAMKMTHKRGLYHVTFPWYKNDEREENYYYSDPVQPTVVSAFSLKSSKYSYAGRDDLKNATLCRPAGYFTHDIADLIKAGTLKHVAPPNINECFRLLVKGEVDLVSEDDQVGKNTIKAMDIADKIKISDEPMMIKPLYVIFPKRFGQLAMDLRDQFNAELKKLDESGDIAEIVIRHLSN